MNAGYTISKYCQLHTALPLIKTRRSWYATYFTAPFICKGFSIVKYKQLWCLVHVCNVFSLVNTTSADTQQFWMKLHYCWCQLFWISLYSMCFYSQVDTGTKLHCELEPKNSLSKKAITIKTKDGDTVGHVPDLLAHALPPEICGGNIVEAIYWSNRYRWTKRCSRKYMGDRRCHWNAIQVPYLRRYETKKKN